MKNIFKPQQKNQKGFTIVELMIALSVLSVLLLISSLVMMQIGSLYTKGLNQANLQNAARNVQEDIASAIEFSGSSPAQGTTVRYNGIDVRSLCIGNVRYSYVLDRKLGTDTSMALPQQVTRRVLWRDVMTSMSSCSPVDITAPINPAEGYEMMPNNTRLTALSVAETVASSGIYRLDVNSAYGDTDLVSVIAGVPTCRGGVGSQFCAISILTTQVSSRL